MYEILLKLNDFWLQKERILSYKGENHTNSGIGSFQAFQ
jgi:hypothetical protein